MRAGFGIEIFPNGSTYEGEYYDGKPHGEGTFKWANGEIYSG